MPKLFISYPRDELAFAHQLDATLRDAGHETWFYARDYDPSRDHADQIIGAMRGADVLLVVVTQRALRSSGMQFEQHTMSMLGRPIIPVLLYAVSELPTLLRQTPPIDFQGDFDAAVPHLLQAISTAKGVPSPTTLLTNVDLSARVVILYKNLQKTHHGTGTADAARTTADYLTGEGYLATPLNFSEYTIKDAAAQTALDSATHVIAVLSRSVVEQFVFDDEPLKAALRYTLDANKPLTLLTVSRHIPLEDGTAFAGSLARLRPAPAYYLPPMYLPPDAAKRHLQPVLKRLSDAPVPAATTVTGAVPLPPNLTHHIFLSYKRMDNDTMRRVRDDLETAGFVVWTDELIEKGTPQWQREIEQAIRGTATLVCLLSPEAAQSDYVREELAAAKLFKKPIFLALIRGTREQCFIYGYMNSQMTDLRNADTYQHEFDLLAGAIRGRL